MADISLRPIGQVVSSLKDAAAAPRQADEGAPAAWLVLDPALIEALADLRPGDEIVIVTWLDRARRDLLRSQPHGDPDRRPLGVFSTRAAHRPNPIGLHATTVVAVEGCRIKVAALEALDGTPIIDLKPTLPQDIAAR
jgi:tRNA-Thr(GGU) m(6)t(6)A37 methyltransferase TsaA